MSGVAVVRYILANDADLIAQVPASRIFSGTIPQNAALPAIGVKQISGVPRLTTSMAETKRMTIERVQVTIDAPNYPTQKAVLALLWPALRGKRGTVNGVDLDSILPDVQGPDLPDATTMIQSQSHDFIVKWRS